MKASQILIFIISVIICLTLLAFYFPVKGIYLGGLSLRFPSVEKILTHSSSISEMVEEVEIPEIVAKDSVLQTLQDSVAFYRSLVENELGKFYFPNDDIHYFDALFQKMERAKDNEKVIRVLHYGDSQIELDRISLNLRAWFQTKFGGGGPGLLPAVQTIPTGTVSQSSSGNYTIYSIYGDGLRRANGHYGLMCKCFSMNGHNTFYARSSGNKHVASSMKRFSIVKLLFDDHHGDFSATLNDKSGNSPIPRVSNTKGFQSFIWKLDTPTVSISLSLDGSADIFGVFIDGDYGVNVDNIPLRGSAGTIFTMIDDSLLQRSYKESNVGLIILQFGGNAIAGISSVKGAEAYAKKMERQIRYIRKVYPEAKILFIGPSDMTRRVEGDMRTYPFLPETVAALKQVAVSNGAAFWDMFEVMGGENSMMAWYNHGLAGPDFIHFTASGADKIGTMLTNSFEYVYQFYASERFFSIVKKENSNIQ